MSSGTVKLLSVLVIAGSLAAGILLRAVRLDTVPPGLHCDEACNGYDAYSLLHTGCDHRGNLLPLSFQGFNDYRMPLFDYSLLPLIETLGLKPAVVRLGAAIWGIVDLGAMTVLAGLLGGWPVAAATALLGALSPWHLALSRYGIEATAASAAITLAVCCFFSWERWRRRRWLVASAAFFGLSLYAYSITKVATPLLVAWLAFSYRRELTRSRSGIFWALGTLLLFAAPQGILMLLHPAETQARFGHLSIFRYMSMFNPDATVWRRIVIVGANYLSYFTPSYLFTTGDRGDHWTLLYPPRFGLLLPEEAPLILLGLLALFRTRERKAAALLVVWVAIAALPAAMIVPLGAEQPDYRPLPTPFVMFDHATAKVALTPQLLLAHPDSRHDSLAMVPWIVLSALGSAFCSS